MKKFLCFLTATLLAVGMTAENLSGSLPGTQVAYSLDYELSVDNGDNAVVLQGTLNAEALAVPGMAATLVVAGQKDAAVQLDADKGTVYAKTNSSYLKGDVLQLAVLFEYTDGKAMTDQIVYTVAPQTVYKVQVPAETPACYLTGVAFDDAVVPMDKVDDTHYTYVADDNLVGKSYFYTCGPTTNFRELDAAGKSVSRQWTAVDMVAQWQQTCEKEVVLIVDALEGVFQYLDYKNKTWSIQNVSLRKGQQIAFVDTCAGVSVAPETVKGYYGLNRVSVGEGIEMYGYEVTESGVYDFSLPHDYKSLTVSKATEYSWALVYSSLIGPYHRFVDVNAFSGWNTTVTGEQTTGFNISCGTESATSNTALGGIAAYNVDMTAAADNDYLFEFTYKHSLSGSVSLQLRVAADDPANAEVLGSIEVPASDTWSTISKNISEFVANPDQLILEQGEKLYVVFEVEGEDFTESADINVSNICFSAQTTYTVQVPVETEVCYVETETFELQAMTRVNDSVFTYTCTGANTRSDKYTYYSGIGEDYQEVNAGGTAKSHSVYKTYDVVVAWKNTYCVPKYSLEVNSEYTPFVNNLGLWVIDEITISDSTEAKVIDECTGQAIATQPFAPNTYKVTLDVNGATPVVTVDTISVKKDKKMKEVIWTGNVDITWNDGGRVLLPASAFEGWPAGSKLVLCYTQKDQQWAQAQLNNGQWSQISFPEVPSGTLVPTDIYGWTFDSRKTELTLTQEILDNIQTNQGNCEGVDCGMIIQGSDLIFTSVYIYTDKKIAWTGNVDITWSDGGRVLIPVNAFDGWNAGAKLVLCYEQKDQTWAQAQLNNGGWSQISFPEVPTGTLVPTDVYGWTFDKRETALTLTQEVLDNIRTNHGVCEGVDCGMIIQGSDLIFTSAYVTYDGEQTIWTGNVDITWSDGGRVLVPIEPFTDYEWKAGSELVLCYEQKDQTWAQAQLNNGGWSQISFPEVPTGTLVPTDVYGWTFDKRETALTLTQEVLDNIITNHGVCEGVDCGMIIQGSDLIFTKVYLRVPKPIEILCYETAEVTNAWDENAENVNDTLIFKAPYAGIGNWLGEADWSAFNTVEIEYTSNVPVLFIVQDGQHSVTTRLPAMADTIVANMHYFSDLDMSKISQYFFQGEQAGWMHVISLCLSKVDYPTYYIANNWNNDSVWSYVEMTTDNYGYWFAEGIYGGNGVKIAEDENGTNEMVFDEANIQGEPIYVMDQIAFTFDEVEQTVKAELKARPTWMKHPFDGSNWVWEPMTRNEELHQWEYVSTWGGSGANINANGPVDGTALWMAANEHVIFLCDGFEAEEPAVGTQVTFCYHNDDADIAVKYDLPEGVEDLILKAEVQKVIINGELYILREGEMYNVMGATVR